MRRGIRSASAEELAWLGLVPAVFLLALGLELLATPLGNFIAAPDYPVYAGWRTIGYVRPEAFEQAGYAIAVAVPMVLGAAVLLWGSARPRRPSLTIPVIAIQLAVIAFVVWNVRKQPDNITLHFLGAFKPYLLPKRNLVAGPLIGLGLVALALAWHGPRLTRIRELVARLNARAGWAAPAIAIAITAVWLLPGVLTESNLADSGQIPPGHVPLQFDEWVAISNGRTALVDYIPYYASLLPILFSPLFPLFDFSIASFTITMSLLSLVGLTAAYGALHEVVRRRPWQALALYLPLMAMALQPWRVDGAVREFNGIYYPIMPIRYLGPFVVAWLLARHLRRGSPPVWVLFGAAGLTVLNNVEFGVGCLIALTLAQAFIVDREQPLWEWVRPRLVQAGLGLLGALVLVYAVILIRSGELADLRLLSWVARLARDGYGLLPIPEWGFHWALYCTYAGAVLTAAVRAAHRAPDRTLTGMLAYAGLFGFATGGYFVGRSVPWQLWGLFPAWGFALSVLGWTAWLALRSARPDREAVRRVAVACFAALAGFGVMVATLDLLPRPWTQLDRITDDGAAPAINDRSAEIAFIESRTEPGEEVLILGNRLDHRVAERAGVVNVSPWYGAGALLGPNETERMIDQLEESGGTKAFLNIADRFVAPLPSIESAVNAEMRERGWVPVITDPASGSTEWQLRQAG